MSESTNHLFWLPALLGQCGWAGDVHAGAHILPQGWLLFKKQDGESWCLPLSHLISYSHRPDGVLELKFTTHCMKFDCAKLDAREIIDKILQGSISLIEERTPEQLDSSCLFVSGLKEEDPREDYGTEP